MRSTVGRAKGKRQRVRRDARRFVKASFGKKARMGWAIQSHISSHDCSEATADSPLTVVSYCIFFYVWGQASAPALPFGGGRKTTLNLSRT